MPATAEIEKPMMGLTTTKAAFIERAQNEGQLYITQPYELYSDDNHRAWRMVRDVAAHRAEQEVTDPTSPSGPNHKQLRALGCLRQCFRCGPG